VAVRDGVIAALPLVLVGSFFLLLAQPPSATLQGLAAGHLDTLLLPYRMLSGVVGLYVCFGVARALARSYGLEELGASLVAVASFLCCQQPAPLVEGGWGLAASRLGAGGLFGAISVALVSVEVQRLVARRGWIVRLPASVPEPIAQSFAAIVPAFCSILAVWLLVHGLGVDVLGLVSLAVAPLVGATDSLPGVMVLSLVDSALWLLGIHPVAILGALKPILLSMLTENMAAAAEGRAIPYVATREFFLWFVWQGGSGGTLAAALLLFRARSSALRVVGKVGIVPALFNINEPLLFGLPVVMNPRLAIPFLLGPLATSAISYGAMAAGFVGAPRLEVLWTLPAPIGAYLATGGDLRAVALQSANLALSMAIWWPFLRAWDRRLAAGSSADSGADPAVAWDDGAAALPWRHREEEDEERHQRVVPAGADALGWEDPEGDEQPDGRQGGQYPKRQAR
jgi:PTS system cellobiose-specific IIC component